jgi:putative membrane protein
MVTDHGKANQHLQQIMTTEGATLPTELTASQEREIDRLSKLSGVDFDKAYIGGIHNHHTRHGLLRRIHRPPRV